jgi:hypothetical protein
MRRLVLMSGMVLGLIAACGGTTGSPLDNGGGGSSDSGTKPGMDSGTTPGPDGAADGTSMSDTGSADTKPMDARRDTAPDAKTPFDAGCPSFCATHTPKNGTCDDFDESKAVPSDWTVVVNDGGSVAISEAEAFSCSSSLSAYLPMITISSVMAASALAENAFKVGSTVTLDLEVYLPDNDMTSFVTYFALRLGNDAALGLQHHGDGDWFLGNSSTSFPINTALPMPPLVGAWNHMALAIDYSTSAGSATLTYEGSDLTAQSVMFSGATETGAYPDGTAIVGMSAPFETEAAFTAYYDNVIVRIGM